MLIKSTARRYLAPILQLPPNLKNLSSQEFPLGRKDLEFSGIYSPFAKHMSETFQQAIVIKRRK